MSRTVVLLAALAACGGGAGGDDAPDIDSGPPDASAVQCTGGFGAAQPVLGLDGTGTMELGARFSPDEKTAYYTFATDVAAPGDVAYSARESTDVPFGERHLIAAIDTDISREIAPTVSGDGLTLVYVQWADNGDETLWLSTRASVADDFGAPTHLAALDVGGTSRHPYLSRDGERLWFSASDGIRVAERQGDDFPSSTVAIAGGLGELVYPTVSADELEIFVGVVSGGVAIERASRASTGDDFGPLGPVTITSPGNGNGISPTWLSNDGCRLYLYENGVQDANVLVAEREP